MPALLLNHNQSGQLQPLFTGTAAASTWGGVSEVMPVLALVPAQLPLAVAADVELWL